MWFTLYVHNSVLGLGRASVEVIWLKFKMILSWHYTLYSSELTSAVLDWKASGCVSWVWLPVVVGDGVGAGGGAREVQVGRRRAGLQTLTQAWGRGVYKEMWILLGLGYILYLKWTKSVRDVDKLLCKSAQTVVWGFILLFLFAGQVCLFWVDYK